MSSPLYTTEILRLAMGAAMHPRLTAPTVTAESRTPVCGSRIAIDLALDGDGRVCAVGLDVHACAMGQASAGLFAASVVGRDSAGLAVERDALAAWLNGASESAPDWPGMAALAPARGYPARHAAILLPFSAALSALSTVNISAHPELVEGLSLPTPSQKKGSPSTSSGWAGSGNRSAGVIA